MENRSIGQVRNYLRSFISKCTARDCLLFACRFLQPTLCRPRRLQSQTSLRLGQHKYRGHLLYKPHFLQLFVKHCVPATWGLFQAIDATIQFAYQMLFPLFNETLRLLHINLLLKFSVQKCCCYINLM